MQPRAPEGLLAPVSESSGRAFERVLISLGTFTFLSVNRISLWSNRGSRTFSDELLKGVEGAKTCHLHILYWGWDTKQYDA